MLSQEMREAIEIENDQLRERVRQLEEQIGLAWEPPRVFALSGTEGALLGLLVRRAGGCVTKQMVMDALYGDRPEDPPAEKIVDVFICKLRAKMKPYAVAIKTHWGRGYYMDLEDKAKVEALRMVEAGQ